MLLLVGKCTRHFLFIQNLELIKCHLAGTGKTTLLSVLTLHLSQIFVISLMS